MSTATQLSLDEDLFEAKIKPHYWVNQSNSLINMVQTLELNERRIIYPLIALVQPDDNDFKKYVIGVKELAGLIGYKGNSIYEQVKKAIDGIMSKHITLRYHDGKQNVVRNIAWVQEAEYELGTGRVHIKLSDGMAEFLRDLKSFTKYRLMNVLRLTSTYSWRIYELLKEVVFRKNPIKDNKKREWRTSRVIYVSELRKLLDIPDDKLTLMKNFKSVVIDKAKKELKEKTDIEFDYEVYSKAGRSIESFIFYIDENKNTKYPQIDIEGLKDDYETIVNTLIRHGLRKDVAMKLANTYDYHYLDANLRYVLSMDLDTHKNKPGYIVKSIEDNYADYEGAVERKADDPYVNVILSGMNERFNSRSTKDNKDLENILKIYERALIDNPASDLEEIREITKQRRHQFFHKFELINNERENKQLPALSNEEIQHPTVKALFHEWDKENMPY